MVSSSKTVETPFRASFTQIKEPMIALNLLVLRTESFDWFLNNDMWKQRVKATVNGRGEYVPTVSGLQEVLNEMSPIEDAGSTMSLSFNSCILEGALHTIDEYRDKDLTYDVPLYIEAEFVMNEISEIRNQTMFLGSLPPMTPRGMFTINGTERVVMSQLIRSPEVYFKKTADKTSDRDIYLGKVIPSRGVWPEFEINKHDSVGVRIDRKRGQFATIFLKTMGVSTAEIHEAFTGFPMVLEALEKDGPIETQEQALGDIYRKIRPGGPPSAEAGRALLHNFYTNPKRYDLAEVGRYKISKRLGVAREMNQRTLNPADMVATFRYPLALCEGMGVVSIEGAAGEVLDVKVKTDDINRFGSHRMHAVGELIQLQFRAGMSRTERVVRERMSTQDMEAIVPKSLTNTRPVMAVIKEFFDTPQLPQSMNRDSFLAGLTRKRHLSTLGPGGLSRDWAGVEVRDVHPSHYGRMCPVETLRGPNVGPIGPLVIFIRVSPSDFVEAPYRVVYGGVVTGEIHYIIADDEESLNIAQTSVISTDDNHFVEKGILYRSTGGDPMLASPEGMDLMDTSVRQVVSAAIAMIPFLGHNDANRALMRANMQRQAVPLLCTEAPLMGTGTERCAAVDAGNMVVAKNVRIVVEVSTDLVKIQADVSRVDNYKLEKFRHSNQGNCYNQQISVDESQRLEAGDTIADGPATDQGEMALGRSLSIVYTSWESPSYENATILSQRMVSEDLLTSIHIEEHEIDVRDTKPGLEEITCDIPNVSKAVRKDLGGREVVHVGAETHAGNILVGKITPKGETELINEERLLRAILGEKAKEVRGTPLRVPHGESGIVIVVEEFTDEDGDPELAPGVSHMVHVCIDQRRKITIGDKISDYHGNKRCTSKTLSVKDVPFLEDGTPVDVISNPIGAPKHMNIGRVLEFRLSWIAHEDWDITKVLESSERQAKHAPLPIAEPGQCVATPVFDGAEANAITGILRSTQMRDKFDHRPVDEDGKAQLFDGRFGESFPYRTAVDYKCMLKLHHLIDDKIHARSTGSYSMITQQPLGGKAQFGGQRFSGMEVWALRTYGAAYALQEISTVKSDDMQSRVKAYEAIVRDEDLPQPGIPEPFRMLMREMRPLYLNVGVLDFDRYPLGIRDDAGEASRGTAKLSFDLSERPNALGTMLSMEEI